MKNIIFQKHIGSILIVLNVTYFSSQASYAAPLVSPLIIEQNRDQQREIDAEANQRLIQRPTQILPSVKTKIKQLLPKGECRIVTNVFTYGADLIPNSNRDLIIKPILNHCLNNIQITNIANKIQEWYLNSGFITTRVTIKQNQNSFIVQGLDLAIGYLIYSLSLEGKLYVFLSHKVLCYFYCRQK